MLANLGLQVVFFWLATLKSIICVESLMNILSGSTDINPGTSFGSSTMYLRRIYSSIDDKRKLYRGKLISAFTVSAHNRNRAAVWDKRSRRGKVILEYDFDSIKNWLSANSQTQNRLYLRTYFGFNRGEINVYALIKHNARNSYMLLDHKFVKRKWMMFNVSKLIKYQDKIDTRCKIIFAGTASFALRKNKNIPRHKSFIVGFASSMIKKVPRKRRSDKTELGRSACRVTDFIVDLQQIGWRNVILFPKTFNAGRCTGPCSFRTANVFKNNYALMCHILRHVEKGLIRSPYCAPSNLAPLKIIYAISENILSMTYLNDMIVDSCECI
ncbi:hypothetical protein ACOME3_009299 [Neoechinorhynchus agilis]